MHPKCCVCNNSRQDAILHRFPCNVDRRNKWLKCIKREDLCKESSKTFATLFVCQKHFESKFITPMSRLLCKAFPTLLTDEEISSGIPRQETAENIDPLTDHDYYVAKKHFDHTYCRMPPLQEIIPSGCGNIQNLPGTSSMQDAVIPANISINPGPPTVKSLVVETIPSGCSNIENLAEASSMQDTVIPATFSINPGPPAVKSLVVGKVKSARKRIISKVKDLTPECQTLYSEYKKAKNQVNFYKRAKRAYKFAKEKTVDKMTQNLNPFAKTLIKMQINLCTKKEKGRRFTTNEKLVSLAILKQSPKCYTFLQKIFILPSRATLNKMVAKFNIKTGICPQLFDLLKKEVATWDSKKKLCSILFDEMSLDTALTYNKSKDTITGLVELQEKKKEFADHALVFMLRGAVYKWQQPVAYYYCQGATSAIELKNILKDVVSAVQTCGLEPIVIACDQGAAFRSAIKSLLEESKRAQIIANETFDGTVHINGAKLNIIYDPCHLIKGLRNNFLSKNIKLEGKTAKWSDIVDVYKTDCRHTDARLLHKLNDEHVIPEKIKKMKVKNCVKVFSATVSAALSYTAQFSHYVDGRPVSETLKNTAEIINFFDKLFDSVNGSSLFSKKNKGKALRTAVVAKSPHHQFWIDAIEKLNKIKYVEKNGNEKSVPSIQNFIITLKSYLRLWQLFKNKDIKIMRPRYFNTDPIENFFGQVRSYNYRNNDPNCHSFDCTYKSLLITRIIKFHNKTFNCEDDPAEQVLNVKLLFDNNENVQPGHSRSEIIVEQARRERINVHSRAYTAGWVVHKIFNSMNINCAQCKNNLTTQEGNIHDWISHREFNSTKKSLNYPSEGAVRCFGTVISETNEFLEQNAHKNEISSKIMEIILSKNSFDFINCTEHKEMVLNSFISVTVRFSIINWCSVINKILKGTDVIRLCNQNLPPMQKKALEKFKKKLKNKRFNK